MTYSELKTALEAACDAVYEWEALAGAKRFVVLSPYGTVGVIADNAVQLEVQRVQMDICWQTDGDTLLADVKAALTAGDTPYSVEDVSYDPDYAAMRAIVQLEVL